jgi:hypothetical protein
MGYTAMLESALTKISNADPNPTFTFSLFVPGLKWLNRRPKPYGKGSLDRNGGRYKKPGTLGDKPEVYAWVNHIVAHAITERDRIRRSGYDPFPYDKPVQVAALFIYERPHTQPKGPPITAQGSEAEHDTDKLQRALGDALGVAKPQSQWPKAGIITDDKLIVPWLDPQKAFIDQIDWEGATPSSGVQFRVEPYDDSQPIKISKYM